MTNSDHFFSPPTVVRVFSTSLSFLGGDRIEVEARRALPLLSEVILISWLCDLRRLPLPNKTLMLHLDSFFKEDASVRAVTADGLLGPRLHPGDKR